MEIREKNNIFLAITGMFASRLGSLIYTFAIGLYVLKLTGSGQTFAATLLLGILPRVILGPFAGNLADRMEKKILIVGSDVFSALLMILLYIYTLKGELTIPLIYLITLLLSVSSVFLDNAFGAAQRDIVRLESLTRLGSIRHSLESIINLASPIIGGVVYALVPISVFLLINGISFLISAVSEMFIDFNFNKVRKELMEKKSFFSDMKSGFLYFKNDDLLVAIAFNALMINFFLSSTAIMLPYAIVEVMKINGQLYGLATSMISLGALAGAIVIGKLNSKLTRSFLLKMMGSLALAFVLMGFSMHNFFDTGTLSLILISVFAFFMLASATMINIPLSVFFQTRVQPEYLGRISSLFGTMALAVMPVSYMIYGFLSDKISPFIILTLSGVCVLLIDIVMISSKSLLKLDDNSIEMMEKSIAEEKPV